MSRRAATAGPWAASRLTFQLAAMSAEDPIPRFSKSRAVTIREALSLLRLTARFSSLAIPFPQQRFRPWAAWDKATSNQAPNAIQVSERYGMRCFLSVVVAVCAGISAMQGSRAQELAVKKTAKTPPHSVEFQRLDSNRDDKLSA